MRRIMALALGLALLAVMATAELNYTKVSATATAQTTTISGSSLLIVNDGANEVYVRVFNDGETAADATTSSTEIKSGEGLEFYRPMGMKAVSIVCAAAETATVRLVYW